MRKDHEDDEEEETELKEKSWVDKDGKITPEGEAELEKRKK